MWQRWKEVLALDSRKLIRASIELLLSMTEDKSISEELEKDTDRFDIRDVTERLMEVVNHEPEDAGYLKNKAGKPLR